MRYRSGDETTGTATMIRRMQFEVTLRGDTGKVVLFTMYIRRAIVTGPLSAYPHTRSSYRGGRRFPCERNYIEVKRRGFA